MALLYGKQAKKTTAGVVHSHKLNHNNRHPKHSPSHSLTHVVAQLAVVEPTGEATMTVEHGMVHLRQIVAIIGEVLHPIMATSEMYLINKAIIMPTLPAPGAAVSANQRHLLDHHGAVRKATGMTHINNNRMPISGEVTHKCLPHHNQPSQTTSGVPAAAMTTCGIVTEQTCGETIPRRKLVCGEKMGHKEIPTVGAMNQTLNRKAGETTVQVVKIHRVAMLMMVQPTGETLPTNKVQSLPKSGEVLHYLL